MRSWMAADSLRNLVNTVWGARLRRWEVRGTGMGSDIRRRGKLTDREGFTYVLPRGDKRGNQERVEEAKRRAAGCFRYGKPGHFARDCLATAPKPQGGPRRNHPSLK